MLLTTVLLLVVTALQGGFHATPFFIGIESLLNAVIIIDFVCRLRLMGVKRFFFENYSSLGAQNTASLPMCSGRVWNWIDCIVIMGSFIMFIGITISRANSPSE